MKKSDHSTPSQLPRVHAYLAQLGYGSRRQIEALIEKGKIQINAKPAKLGQKLRPGEDEIRIRGKAVGHIRPNPMVLLLNKPRGIIVTTQDPQGRKSVMDLLPRKLRRGMFPVGRLDLNSEGLLVMTNDGDLAHRLMHPRFDVPKVYEVKIRGELTKKKMEHIEKGMTIEGQKYKGAEILSVKEVTREGFPKFSVRLRIYEGKNHHIRKMFNTLRCHVLKLKRLSIGSLSLKGVPLGDFKVVTGKAVDKIRADFSGEKMEKRKRA